VLAVAKVSDLLLIVLDPLKGIEQKLKMYISIESLQYLLENKRFRFLLEVLKYKVWIKSSKLF
jgi:hypothetical protein